MRSLSDILIVLSLSATAGAQGSAPAPLINAVQVVTYIDLEPAEAGSASSLLIKQVQEEQRNAGCITIVLIEEDGRRNHFVLIERWRTARDLDTVRNGIPYKRFRSDLQPSLASPLDERIGHQVAP